MILDKPGLTLSTRLQRGQGLLTSLRGCLHPEVCPERPSNDLSTHRMYLKDHVSGSFILLAQDDDTGVVQIGFVTSCNVHWVHVG